MKCVVRVLCAALPFAKALTVLNYRRTSFAQISLGRCANDPNSCVAGRDQMLETASSIKVQLREELNATRKRFETIVADFDGCDTHLSQAQTYRKRLEEKAREHRVCREAQNSLHSAWMTCKQLLGAVKENETLLCNSEILTAQPSDLVSLCEPTTLEPLGMWLQDMRETFATRHTQWQRHSRMCQEAKQVVPTQEDACRISQEKLESKESDCDGKLSKMETFACSWVVDTGSRCTAYDTCFESVLSRHTVEVRQANASVQRWKESWLAASRMECMANAMDARGSVDEAKIHACEGWNITNMSFIKVVIPQPPAKVECPSPEIFPGSTSYEEVVYGRLPAGLPVRPPIHCPSTRQCEGRLPARLPVRPPILGPSTRPCSLVTYGGRLENSPYENQRVLDKITAPANRVGASHMVTDIELSGGPGCSAIFFCDRGCMGSGGLGVHPYKFVYTIGADGKEVVRHLYGTMAWGTNQRATHLFHPQNAKLTVSRSAPPARAAQWAFSMWRDNPIVIKWGDTATGHTELSVLLESKKYRRWDLVNVAEAEDRSERAFDSMPNGNVMMVRMGPTESGRTEIQILWGRSHWRLFEKQTSTVLHATDQSHGRWAFTVMPNNDLMAIKMGPDTGTGKTEVHVLSSSSNYQSFSLQTGTGLHLTHCGEWSFQAMRNRDLMVIKMGPDTGTSMTEVQILSASSNYQIFSLHTGTPLQLTDRQHGLWAFEVMYNDDLMAFEMAPESGSGMAKVHILSASSRYTSFSRQTVTPMRVSNYD